MLEYLHAIKIALDTLMPLFVAGVTVVGTVLVAKINRVGRDSAAAVQKVDEVKKDIITNHGSKNIGDAIDRLTTKVDVINDNQQDLIRTVRGMQARDEALEHRVSAIEHRKVLHTSPIPSRPFGRLLKKRNHGWTS